MPTLASIDPADADVWIYRNRPVTIRLQRSDSTNLTVLETTQADFADGTLTDVDAPAAELRLLMSSKCVDLDGTSGTYVTFASAPTAAVNNVTMEAVIRPSTTPSDAFIGYIGNSSSDGWGIWIDTNQKIVALCGGVGYATSDYVIAAGTTARVKICRAAGTWKIWVNGTERTVSGNPTPGSPTDSFRIGAAPEANASRFDGRIDEVRVWTINSPSNDILTEVAGTETGLVGAWHFNEGTGTTTADATSGGRTGTLAGAAGWTTIGVPWATAYATSGSRVSPAYSLASVGKVGGTWASWSANVPGGTSLTIEASLNGSTWYELTNGAPVPTILQEGDDVSAASLYIRESMTGPGTGTPVLYDLTVTFRPVEPRSVEVVVNGISCTVANGRLDYWNTATYSGGDIIDWHRDVWLAAFSLWWDSTLEEITVVVKYKGTTISTTTFTAADDETLWATGNGSWMATALAGLYDGPMSGLGHYFVGSIEPWLVRGEGHYHVAGLPVCTGDGFYWVAHLVHWHGPGAAAVGQPTRTHGPGAAALQGYARTHGPGAVTVQGYTRSHGPGAVVLGVPSRTHGPGAAIVATPMRTHGPGAATVYGVNRRTALELRTISDDTADAMAEMGITVE